jgi:hypothetical protein
MKRKRNIVKAYHLMGIGERATDIFLRLDEKYGSHIAVANKIENRKRLIEFWIKGLRDPENGAEING